MPETETAPRSPRLTALVVAAALFMQNVDSTVIATALPAMAASFGADVLRLSLALTAYMLSLAVFIPASGWIADRFGPREVFRAAIVVFCAGSALSGLAPSLPLLVAGRVVQGVGGALMVPVGRLVLLRSVPKTELVSAMAWLTVPALIGPIIGPPLGGLIVTHVSWRWVFFLNLPVGALGLVLVSRLIPRGRPASRRALDGPGLVLSGLGLTGLIFGAELAARPVFGAGLGLAILAGGLSFCALYIRHARCAARPVLDLRLLSVPSFGLSVYAGSLFRIGVGAVPFLLPTMLQVGFGMSAAEAGLITFSASVGAIAMKPAAGPLLRRFGFRTMLFWNGVASVITLAACAAFRPATPWWMLHGVLITGGFFRSLQFTAFNTIAFGDIRQHRMADATGFYSTMQQVSLTLGVVTAAAVLEASMVLGGRAAPGTGDFSAGFLVVSLAMALSVPVVARLPRDAGAVLSGHRGA
ncbi:MAG: MFS transporter [Acetobacteraceae bacterium]|nr:MFS transporter [Acetobacteraceae bacterium]